MGKGQTDDVDGDGDEQLDDDEGSLAMEDREDDGQDGDGMGWTEDWVGDDDEMPFDALGSNVWVEHGPNYSKCVPVTLCPFPATNMPP